MKRLIFLIIALLSFAQPASPATQYPISQPYQQFFDQNGVPLSGGSVYTCQPGTTCTSPSMPSPKATYTDSTGSSANTNPIILDSAGRANFWGTGFYKFSIYDALSNLIKTQDNVPITYDYVAPSSVPWIDASIYGSLNAAIASIGSTPATLVIKTANFPMTGAAVVPTTLRLKVEYPGSLANAAYPLTIGSDPDFPLNQVFTGTGSVSGLKKAYPEYWGVTGANDEVAVNAAMNSLTNAGDLILAQTYYIDANPVIMKSGVNLKSIGRANSAAGLGGILYNRRTSGGAVLVPSATTNFNIENIGIRGANTPIYQSYSTAGTYGIEASGTVAGGPSTNAHFTNVDFYRLHKGIYIYDATPGSYAWSFANVKVDQPVFNECNFDIHTNTQNANIQIHDFTMNYLVRGLFAQRMGNFQLKDGYGGGAGGYTGNSFIETGTISTSNIEGTECEQTNYCWLLNGPGNNSPINVTGNIFDAYVLINNDAVINFKGNTFNYANVMLASGNTYAWDENNYFYPIGSYDFILSNSSMLVHSTRVPASGFPTERWYVTADDNQSKATAINTELTTTNATLIASLIPTNLGGVNSITYQISCSVLSTGTPTVHIYAIWLDGGGVSNQKDLLASTALIAGSYNVPVSSLIAVNGGTATSIKVYASSTVANVAYISAQIKALPH